jgi:ribonuclease HI
LEFSPYTLEFQSCQTIKSQALVDFIVEWTDMNMPVSKSCFEHWKMYFDGSLNIHGAGASVYFISPSRDKLSYILRIHFKASNNAAEYEATLHGFVSLLSSASNGSWFSVTLFLSSVRLTKTGTALARRWMLIALKSES